MKQSIDQIRMSIRRKMFLTVFGIVLVAMILTSVVGIVSMTLIRQTSEQYLRQETEENLMSTVAGKTDRADATLLAYEQQTEAFASYIHEMYVHADEYVPTEVPPVDAKNAGTFIMQQAASDESVDPADYEAETLLLSNAAHVFYPVISPEDSPVAAIYLATEKGHILCYDDQSDIKAGMLYYNYFESNWYSLAKEQQKVCFTDVYLDNFGRGLTVTCTAPVYDETDTFAGVVAMDIIISDLYEDVVRVNLTENAYAILVDNAGKVISPEGTDEELKDDPELDDKTTAYILAGESGCDLTAQGTYFAYAPVSVTGWKYCIRVPGEDVIAPVEQVRSFIRYATIIFVGVMLLIVSATALASRKFSGDLTRPIIALQKDAKEISGGNFEHRAVAEMNDEIGDLAHSFNDMADSLKQYIANLTKVTAEKERIGAELDVATRIQADMLPRIFPPFPERGDMDIFASMDPAKEVGGDFYDFFMVDEHHLALVMADVSGKGVPAALFMVIAKTLIKNRLQSLDRVDTALTVANDQLAENNDEMLFVTAWACVVDLRNGETEFADAGHEFPLVLHPDGTVEEFHPDKKLLPLAAFEGTAYPLNKMQLDVGDKLFLYTDGVPEATAASGELYGMERLTEVLKECADKTPEETLKTIRASVDAFVGEAEQFDDLTMLCFERKP